MATTKVGSWRSDAAADGLLGVGLRPWRRTLREQCLRESRARENLGKVALVRASRPASLFGLSPRRAEAVVTALVEEHGIDEVRLTPCGEGRGKPVAENATEEGKAKNRRAEIIKMD